MAAALTQLDLCLPPSISINKSPYSNPQMLQALPNPLLHGQPEQVAQERPEAAPVQRPHFLCPEDIQVRMYLSR